MTPNELFKSSGEKFSDPRLQFWDDKLSQLNTKTELEVDWPPFLLGQTVPRLAIRSSEVDSMLLTRIGWDEALNGVLISHHVRALDHKQEAIRFSLALRSSFKPVEIAVGDGYFNSVFFAILRESRLAEYSVLEPLVQSLDFIHNTEAADPTERYKRSHAMIQAAIRARGSDLTEKLGYSIDEAREILVAALVDFIDRRFSVSINRQRGRI